MNELNDKKPYKPVNGLNSIKNENEFGLGVTSNNVNGSSLFSTTLPKNPGTGEDDTLPKAGGPFWPTRPTPSCTGGGGAANMRYEEDIIL